MGLLIIENAWWINLQCVFRDIYMNYLVSTRIMLGDGYDCSYRVKTILEYA